MKINHKTCTIELTKTEMKAAETFGSEMYKDLREARQDNPNYRVKVVTPSKKVDHHKGLTADRMKKYILKHDDEEHSKLMEFYELRGLTSEGKKDEAGCRVSYGELKQWFFMNYPECKEMHGNVRTPLCEITSTGEIEQSFRLN